MKKYLFVLKEIWKGKSITRGYLNFQLLSTELKGKTIDIGGGRGEEYVSFIRRSSDVEFQTFDPKSGDFVDFEEDRLPADENRYDTVLFLNVMEHIFNYQHIANEVMRITKPGGQMIGFVPFLMWYHPDHKDFFRYTHEAIEIICERAGAKEIKVEPTACGPFVAAAQMMMLSFPRVLRPFVFTPMYLMDELFYLIKGSRTTRYALGYVFICSK